MCKDDKKQQPSVPTKDSDFADDIRHRTEVIVEKMERPEPWPAPPPEEPESKK